MRTGTHFAYLYAYTLTQRSDLGLFRYAYQHICTHIGIFFGLCRTRRFRRSSFSACRKSQFRQLRCRTSLTCKETGRGRFWIAGVPSVGRFCTVGNRLSETGNVSRGFPWC